MKNLDKIILVIFTSTLLSTLIILMDNNVKPTYADNYKNAFKTTAYNLYVGDDATQGWAITRLSSTLLKFMSAQYGSDSASVRLKDLFNRDLYPSRDILLGRNLYFGGDTDSMYFSAGYGDPNGSLNAPVGSVYIRKDGGDSAVFYVRETLGGSSTGWVALNGEVK